MHLLTPHGSNAKPRGPAADGLVNVQGMQQLRSGSAGQHETRRQEQVRAAAYTISAYSREAQQIMRPIMSTIFRAESRHMQGWQQRRRAVPCERPSKCNVQCTTA